MMLKTEKEGDARMVDDDVAKLSWVASMPDGKEDEVER